MGGPDRPSILFLFIDGLGIGPDDAAVNPLLAACLPHLASLVPIDMAAWRAGVYTGVNAAALLGRHKEGRPNKALRSILREYGLIPVLNRAGRRATFANAYTAAVIPPYLAGTTPMSCTSAMAYYGEGRFRTTADANGGAAVFFDLTGRWARRRSGEDVRRRTPRDAGLTLGRLAAAYDFTLYEYFLTDFAGHRQNMERAVRYVEDIDAALGGVLDSFAPDRGLVVLTSDHGNVEDLGVRTHTTNAVPFFVTGAGHREVAARCRSILDVAAACLAYLGVSAAPVQAEPADRR